MKTQSAILAPNGRPFEHELSLSPPPSLPKKPDRLEQAQDYPVYDRYASEIGFGLKTVGLINDAFLQAEYGYPQMQCDLFEKVIERDGHLRGALEGRVDAVAGKEWIVAAGGDSSDDVRAAGLLNDALHGVENWQDTLEYQLDVNSYGYSATEIDWTYVEKTSAFVPTWFRNVPRRRFRFDLDNDNPRIFTQKNMTYGEDLARGKWLFSRRRGRLTAMSGLMRTAIWYAVIKRWALRDWTVFSQRYGLPYVTASYQNGADDLAKSVAKKAIQDLGSDGGAILSDLITLQIHELQHGGGKTTDVQGALCDRCDMEVSKLISGATLTSGTGGPGSFALGRVHADVRFELVLGDALRLAQRFQQQIAAPFVAFNGFKARPPQLKLHVMREVDPATRAKVLAELQAMGVALDEGQLRQEFQVKQPPPGAGLKAAAPVPQGKDDKNSGDATFSRQTY